MQQQHISRGQHVGELLVAYAVDDVQLPHAVSAPHEHFTLIAVAHEHKTEWLTQAIGHLSRVHNMFEPLFGAHVSGVKDHCLAVPSQTAPHIAPIGSRRLDVAPIGDDRDAARFNTKTMQHCLREALMDGY
jgi:hypothetical protein